MLNTVIRIKNKMIYFIYYYYYLYKYSQLLIICFLLSLWIISIYFIKHNINIFFVAAQGPFETNSIAEFALKQNNKNLNVVSC